ncbi:GAF domain-containing protein [Dactylosporangium sp. NPDC051485]|uniref:GAF domain-containing protein n=1 Tax=Dactylosporangium sp. NPDC051485 TaxID=3154846 RepID=UPI003412F24D
MIDVLTTAAAVRDVARLHAVAATGLRAQPEPWCDRVVQLTARLLQVPIVLLVLVERFRQIMPGATGLPEPWQRRRETPLSHSICQYVVGAGRSLAIADLRRHPVLHTSDAIGDLGVTAYAGAPVHGRDGHVLGTLCVIDGAARAWSGPELAALHRAAARCSRKLQALESSPPPVRREPLVPAAPPPPPAGRAAGDVMLWTPGGLPAALTLDRRFPAQSGAAELTLAGRWHGEPVAVIVRTADHPGAVRRFRRRLGVAQAFRRCPPRLPVPQYRWHDDRTLVITRALGEPLRGRGGTDWAAATHLAALLSTWRPTPSDARRWTVDYAAWIARHERAGRLSGDEADRLAVLVRRCQDDRTFAHGSLSPRDVVRLASGRLALTGFTHAGMYLAGIDLAALAFAAPEPGLRRAIDARAVNADIVEPFAVNLLLHAADRAARPPGPVPAVRVAALLDARRHARRLLADLGV